MSLIVATAGMACLAALALGGFTAPTAQADPAYCYSSGNWIVFPDTSGYCLDGESPFNGPGPSYGGGNHRWPSGEDD